MSGNKSNSNGVAKSDKSLLTIIAPVYNEDEVLTEFHNRLSLVMDSMSLRTEILYVNDGSTDNTLNIIYALQQGDTRISIVDLSRNFGKEIAISAGLDHARGDAVVIIDSDLQDPPELIPELIRFWKEGYDNVYAKRIERDGESLVKKVTAYFFYRLIKKITKIELPEDTGDFRLLSRRAVDSLTKMREQHRFMKGLFAWIGYPSKAVPYHRDPRFAGVTKWNYWKLWNFALEGITSFSIAPLKIATYLGSFVAVCSFIYATIIIYKTLVFGEPVQGYPSTMTVILFLGGIQLITLGMIGEYLGRMFNETKNRPLYYINQYSSSSELFDECSGG